jgi:hypothetical protein
MHEGKLGNERFIGESMVKYTKKVVKKISS